MTTNLPEFKFELAQQLYGSTEIIDLDWAWLVLGYDKKGNAKRMLVSYFELNFDYFVQATDESPESLPRDIFLTCENNSKLGRPVEKIYLTVDCFKEMGMLAKSEEGKQIRKYFLQCENIAKSAVLNYPELQQTVKDLQQSFELLAAQVQNLLPPDSNVPPPGWNKDAWNELPSQDKRHFRFLHRRRGFTPDMNPVPGAFVQDLSNTVKQKQQAELEAAVKPLSPEEVSRLEMLKRKALEQTF